jgi:hypothetical protein
MRDPVLRRRSQAAYRLRHPERMRAKGRKYYRKHAEKINARLREWRKKNPGYSKNWKKITPEYYREWRKKHPKYTRKYIGFRRRHGIIQYLRKKFNVEPPVELVDLKMIRYENRKLVRTYEQ